MKVKASVLALLAVLPAAVFAYPAFGGGRGLFRVQNALVEPEAGLTASLHGLVRDADFQETGPNPSGWIADLIAPELSYAPVASKYVGIELFGSWGGAFQTPKSPDSSGFASGFGDLKAGGKISVPIIPVLKLGVATNYTFKSRETKTGWDMLDPKALPYNASRKLAWSGLATFQLQDVAYPAPNVILNYGEVAGLTQYGAGAELEGRNFSVFVEAVSEQPGGGVSGGVFDTEHGHIYVTPGITIGATSSAFLQIGYSFGIGSESFGVRQAENEFILGFGLAALPRRSGQEFGQIVGTVTDASTGAPLAATVTFPDHPRLQALTTDTSTGVFKAARVPAEAVTVMATAEGYESQTLPLMVENHTATAARLELTPIVKPVAVIGRVSDRKTGDALAATIMVPEADSTVLNTDSATGVYKTHLKPGIYTLVVESKDYVKQLATLIVERDKPLTKDFRLVKVGMTITLRGINFDFDKADIRPDSKPVLDDAAKILTENPTIMVEIQGHTDGKGSNKYNLDLSERRARAVVRYFVENGGIDKSRLTAKGYGKARPIATNDTDEGRALNRRVEFVILGQTEQSGQTGQIAPDQR